MNHSLLAKLSILISFNIVQPYLRVHLGGPVVLELSVLARALRMTGQGTQVNVGIYTQKPTSTQWLTNLKIVREWSISYACRAGTF